MNQQAMQGALEAPVSQPGHMMAGLQPKTGRALFIAAFGYAWVLVRFFFSGSWGIDFFLFILLTELFLYGWKRIGRTQMMKPVSAAQKRLLMILAAASLFLGASYALWTNPLLRLLNLPVLLALLVMQFLLYYQAASCQWDQPFFWFEASLAGFVRPFSSLGRLRCLMPARTHKSGSWQAGRLALSILIGLCLAVPLLLVVGALLMSADAVFSERLSQFYSSLLQWPFSRVLRQLAYALLLAPFVFSFMASGQGKAVIAAQDQSLRLSSLSGQAQQMIQTAMVTLLVCLNLLYLLFAVTQLQYLTGAFVSILPDHLTYAEYARSGFFELLAVSLINVILLFVAVRLGHGPGRTRWLLRALVLLTIACSLVQWVSAMTRMGLYVKTYSLTRLRFMSTAFMWLILAWYVLMVLRTFLERLPLFKALATAALAALITLNAVVPDRRIASHQVRHYLTTAETQGYILDTAYLVQLSDDALPALLPLLLDADPDVAGQIAAHFNDRQLVWQAQDWNDWHLSQWLALRDLRAENRPHSAGRQRQ